MTVVVEQLVALALEWGWNETADDIEDLAAHIQSDGGAKEAVEA